MARRSLDPAAVARKYAQSMAGAQTAYTAGVQAVQQSPTAAAATPQAMQSYIDGVQRSVASGKRAQALQAVSLQAWKDAAVQKGAPRLASGAQQAVPKVQAHFQAFGPVYQQMSDAVQGMPKGGQANAVARFSAALNVLMTAAGRQ